MDANGFWHGLTEPRLSSLPSPPRILIIGAGARGNAYARAITESTDGVVVAVAEPVASKRNELGRRYIWKDNQPLPEQEFMGWKEFLAYELNTRERQLAAEKCQEGVDAAVICTLDEQHATIIMHLAPLKLHILCEKPLTTNLNDCLDVYASLSSSKVEEPAANDVASLTSTIFGIGHVLRYSPHNILLRQLLLETQVVGDILSIEHTEPVGWWHFSHSYVRGNWRKESNTAPSLLTKSCHDIDLLLWLLCSPLTCRKEHPPHLPSKIISTGSLSYFRRIRKPSRAGAATNCTSCDVEATCIYSAKKIYLDRHLKRGITHWPVDIVNPDIEECYNTQGAAAAESMLLSSLAEDYDINIQSTVDINRRPWFGRCVWECTNDVCDDQTVTLVWDDAAPESSSSTPEGKSLNRYAKTATFHMIAHTEAQCERRGRVYGTTGEITYDSRSIRVYDFGSGKEQIHHPPQRGGGHGGGDDGLARQFVSAVGAVKLGV